MQARADEPIAWLPETFLEFQVVCDVGCERCWVVAKKYMVGFSVMVLELIYLWGEYNFRK